MSPRLLQYITLYVLPYIFHAHVLVFPGSIISDLINIQQLAVNADKNPESNSNLQRGAVCLKLLR